MSSVCWEQILGSTRLHQSLFLLLLSLFSCWFLHLSRKCKKSFWIWSIHASTFDLHSYMNKFIYSIKLKILYWEIDIQKRYYRTIFGWLESCELQAGNVELDHKLAPRPRHCRLPPHRHLHSHVWSVAYIPHQFYHYFFLFRIYL